MKIQPQREATADIRNHMKLLNRLNKEYNAWYGEKGDPRLEAGNRGPYSNWRNIENFLKDNYPAAHRGLNAGAESAGSLLEGKPVGIGAVPDLPEYETGPEAVSQHGYDPKEVTAMMLYLHNLAQGVSRDEFVDMNVNQLHDIAQKRSEMQRQYDERQLVNAHRTAMPVPRTARLDDFDRVDNEDRRRADDDIANFHAKRHQDTSSYGQLQNHLYDHFMSWWPTSQAARERDPQTASTNWYCYPDEPITHWLNVEDFLRENYPQSATGAQLGVEQAQKAVNQNLDPDYMHPYEWDKLGLTGTGDHITQAMLSLHNRIQGRTWESPQDEQRYYDLMLKHVGPGAPRRTTSGHRTAMPVPTTVPKTRNQWVKERARLRKLVEKHGLPLDIVPNYDPDWSNQVYDQNWSWQHLRGGRGSPYANRIDRDRTPGIVYHQKIVEPGDRKIPINYLIHNDDEGNITGILAHYPEGSPYEKPGAVTVTVHPQLKGEGIGTKLMQEAIDRFGVDLDNQQYTPYGYELYRKMKSEQGQEVPNIFNERDRPPKMARLAATEAPSLTDEYLDSLKSEFEEWYHSHPEPIDQPEHKKKDHPIGYWPNVEHFFSERYPAAFRGFDMGLEEARPLVREEKNTFPEDYPLYWNGRDYDSESPYETGDEAFAAHGYDPKMVAAAFVLMHNRNNAFWSPRDEELAQDVDFLHKLFHTRVDMQRKTRQQQALDKVLVDASRVIRFAQAQVGEDLYVSGLVDRLKGEFDDDSILAEAAIALRAAARLGATVTDDLGVDEVHEVFKDYVTKARPINPKTGQPHTPETAIVDWPSGVAPFIQATRPDLPFERYQYEPHTRGLYEHQDVPSLVAKLIALHTREKYGTETMYSREKEYEQQAQRLFSDQMDLAQKGIGVRPDGTWGQMPPRGMELRRRMMQPRTARSGEDLYIDGLIDRMSGEFNGWWKDYEPKFIEQNGFGWDDYASITGDNRGPIGHWPHVERFLKERYPATYRGLSMGHEHAGPLLEENEARPLPGNPNGMSDEEWAAANNITVDQLRFVRNMETPYETGPDAVAKHGYDPKEIAATMLMLHSQTHPGRAMNDEWLKADVDRIYDIVRTRRKQQKAYEDRQPAQQANPPVLDSFSQDQYDNAQLEFLESMGPSLTDQGKAELARLRGLKVASEEQWYTEYLRRLAGVQGGHLRP